VIIINGDGGYGLLAAYIGGPAAQVGWLGPKVGGHLAPFLYSSREPTELLQCLCYDVSTRNIVMVIIIITYLLTYLGCDVVVRALASINVLNRHWARLVLGRMTVYGRVNHLGM